MGAPETGWFRTESGTILEMDLPLPEPIAQRVARGEIVRLTRTGRGKTERWVPFEAPPAADPGPSLADDLAAANVRVEELERQLATVTRERAELRVALTELAPKAN